MKVDGRIAIYMIKVSLGSPLTNISYEAPLGLAIFVEVLSVIISALEHNHHSTTVLSAVV